MHARRAYQERLTTLKTVPVTRGPFTFIPVERFGFQKSPNDDESGLTPGWTITVQRYPQIDNPATPEAQRWNAAMAAKYAPSSPDAAPTTTPKLITWIFSRSTPPRPR